MIASSCSTEQIGDSSWSRNWEEVGAGRTRPYNGAIVVQL